MADRDESGYRPSTRLIHGKHQSAKWDYDHHVIPPITASTTFRLDTVHRGQEAFSAFGNPGSVDSKVTPTYIYDRLGEPTIEMLEDTLAEAEGGEIGCAFACGMAAISAAVMVSVRAGENLIAHPTMYGCTYSLLTARLPRFAVDTRLVNVNDQSALAAAIDDKTMAIYLETPANPTLEVTDIARLKAFLAPINAKRGPTKQIVIIVDNTFQTFWGQRPIMHGADIMVGSLTKNVSGFGVDMGGIVIASKKFAIPLRLHRKDFGGVLPPQSAWDFMVYGIPTLPLRLERQVKTATDVAKFLEVHPKVARVSYPGLDSFRWKDVARRQMTDPDGNFCPGAMIYFELKGTSEDALNRSEKMMNHVGSEAYSVTLAVSLGMTKTLIEAPGLMTHSSVERADQVKAGFHPGGIRLAIGIEPSEDIIFDLESALNCID